MSLSEAKDGSNSFIITELKELFPSEILTLKDQQIRQIREVHVGILNMMPDKALKAAERQWSQLLMTAAAGSFRIVPHLITIDGLDREGAAKTRVDAHYRTFSQIQEHNLDALIITGANVQGEDLSKQKFWGPLNEVIEWADENVASTLYSCLAAHAYMLSQHKIKRTKLDQKRWGVYEHQVLDSSNPLTWRLDSDLKIPHSRWNDIPEEKFRDAGMKVLITGPEAGVFMATSADNLSHVLFQGHLEYEGDLSAEWRRDVNGHLTDPEKYPSFPPFPSNYFKGKGLSLAQEFEKSAREKRQEISTEELRELIECTPVSWYCSGEAIFNRWLTGVYNATNGDLQEKLMAGLRADNPLGGDRRAPPQDPDYLDRDFDLHLK